RPGRAIRADTGSGYFQKVFPRCFNETTISSLRAAISTDRPVEPSNLIRPNNHLAAVAGSQSVRSDLRVRTHKGGLRVLHIYVGPVSVAPDEDGAAAAIATDVKDGFIKE